MKCIRCERVFFGSLVFCPVCIQYYSEQYSVDAGIPVECAIKDPIDMNSLEWFRVLLCQVVKE